MTFLGYRYHAGDGSRVIPSAITPVRHRAPPRGGDPWPPLREAARAALVTASHVRMVLGRDRVRGRESTGRSFTPGFQDRSKPIPSTYAGKHPINARTARVSPGRSPLRRAAVSEVHVAAAGGSGHLLLLRLLRDHCLGGEE